MTIALTHNEVKDMNELRKIAENYMRNELVRVDGIADIQLNGQEQAIVEISTNPYMLEAFGLTADGLPRKSRPSIKMFPGNDHGRGYSIHGERGKPDYQSPRY